MNYTLQPDVYACQVNGTVVLLDLRSGHEETYYALDQDQSREISAAIAGAQLPKDASSDLSQWLAPSNTPCPFELKLPLTERSLIEEPLAKVGLAEIVTAVGKRLTAEFSWSSSTMHTSLKELRMRKALAPPSGERSFDIYRKAVAAMLSAGNIVGARDRCFSRSVALMNYLLAQNAPATFVIGVKLNPFAAHAWVQVGPVVLNDMVDEVRQYTPILAA